MTYILVASEFRTPHIKGQWLVFEVNAKQEAREVASCLSLEAGKAVMTLLGVPSSTPYHESPWGVPESTNFV